MDLVEEVSKRVVRRLKREGAKKDKEFREKAERVYSSLLKALENRKEVVLKPVESGLFADEKEGMFYIDGEDIGFDNFVFYFGEAGERNPSYFDSDEMFEHAIFIPALKKSGNTSNLASRVDYYYKDAVIHELIHAFDNERMSKDISPLDVGSSSSNPKEYYNSDDELNTYYQEAIYRFENFLEEKGENEKLEYIQNNLTSFKNFKFLIFQSFLFGRFVDNLTEKNRKKLIKRLYKYYSKYIQDKFLNKN